jgi:hypothetical protein
MFCLQWLCVIVEAISALNATRESAYYDRLYKALPWILGGRLFSQNLTFYKTAYYEHQA